MASRVPFQSIGCAVWRKWS